MVKAKFPGGCWHVFFVLRVKWLFRFCTEVWTRGVHLTGTYSTRELYFTVHRPKNVLLLPPTDLLLSLRLPLLWRRSWWQRTWRWWTKSLMATPPTASRWGLYASRLLKKKVQENAILGHCSPPLPKLSGALAGIFFCAGGSPLGCTHHKEKEFIWPSEDKQMRIELLVNLSQSYTWRGARSLEHFLLLPCYPTRLFMCCQGQEPVRLFGEGFNNCRTGDHE